MFAVGWMELKDPRRAWGLLERSLANVTEPFKASLAPLDPHPDTPASCLGLGGGSGSPALGSGLRKAVPWGPGH